MWPFNREKRIDQRIAELVVSTACPPPHDGEYRLIEQRRDGTTTFIAQFAFEGVWNYVARYTGGIGCGDGFRGRVTYPELGLWWKAEHFKTTKLAKESACEQYNLKCEADLRGKQQIADAKFNNDERVFTQGVCDCE